MKELEKITGKSNEIVPGCKGVAREGVKQTKICIKKERVGNGRVEYVETTTSWQFLDKLRNLTIYERDDISVEPIFSLLQEVENQTMKDKEKISDVMKDNFNYRVVGTERFTPLILCHGLFRDSGEREILAKGDPT